MRNYEEFKGKNYKLEFDASTNSFNYVPLQSIENREPAETILFKPKSIHPKILVARAKSRRVG